MRPLTYKSQQQRPFLSRHKTFPCRSGQRRATLSIAPLPSLPQPQIAGGRCACVSFCRDPSSSVPEPGGSSSRLLPTTRSPVHHGTDPDLSALVPLPPGVAATGLDLSPVMGPGATGGMVRRKTRASLQLVAPSWGCFESTPFSSTEKNRT